MILVVEVIQKSHWRVWNWGENIFEWKSKSKTVILCAISAMWTVKALAAWRRQIAILHSSAVPIKLRWFHPVDLPIRVQHGRKTHSIYGADRRHKSPSLESQPSKAGGAARPSVYRCDQRCQTPQPCVNSLKLRVDEVGWCIGEGSLVWRWMVLGYKMSLFGQPWLINGDYLPRQIWISRRKVHLRNG